MAGPQFVFHMQGLTKAYPGGKKVFENIHLNFLPDAKIGVVAVNGSGKSTLLRIMAAVDKDFVGEALGWPPRQHGIGESDRVRADRVAADAVVAEFGGDRRRQVALGLDPHLLETDHVGGDGPDGVDDRPMALLPGAEPPPQVPGHHTHRPMVVQHADRCRVGRRGVGRRRSGSAVGRRCAIRPGSSDLEL